MISLSIRWGDKWDFPRRRRWHEKTPPLGGVVSEYRLIPISVVSIEGLRSLRKGRITSDGPYTTSEHFEGPKPSRLTELIDLDPTPPKESSCQIEVWPKPTDPLLRVRIGSHVRYRPLRYVFHMCIRYTTTVKSQPHHPTFLHLFLRSLYRRRHPRRGKWMISLSIQRWYKHDFPRGLSRKCQGDACVFLKNWYDPNVRISSIFFRLIWSQAGSRWSGWHLEKSW